MSVRKGTDVIAGHVNYRPDIFDHKWADHVLNNPSWLCADTFSWQDGGVYEAAYNHLVADYTNGTDATETIAGVTIWYRVAPDGHKIVLVTGSDSEHREGAVSTIYSATGVAWYYILDTTNTRFKLPRTKWAVTGLRGNVGDYVAQDVLLPNITGATGGCVGNVAPSGSFTQGGQYGTAGGGSGKFYQNNFSAARSSSVYSGNGNNTLIQPRGTQQHLYFYVGNFTQTALENTAGLNAELFNGKADVSTVAHVVTEFQEPTSANSYTWYRKYADGWVEQGGKAQVTHNSLTDEFTLPIEMANTNYTITVAKWGADTGNVGFQAEPSATTKFKAGVAYGSNLTRGFTWLVCGMAAS